MGFDFHQKLQSILQLNSSVPTTRKGLPLQSLICKIAQIAELIINNIDLTKGRYTILLDKSQRNRRLANDFLSVNSFDERKS
jgi:hypothetical protein